MDGGESAEVTIARLQERIERLLDQAEEARIARGNLNDDVARINVTLATAVNELGNVKAACAAISAHVTWLVYLVISLVVAGLLAGGVGTATGHIH